MDTSLAEIREKKLGHLRIGIHSARARAFLPEAVRTFSKVYPNVKLTLYHSDTDRFEEMLLAGDIDLFFGVNVSQRSEFSVFPLAEEGAWMVASDEFIRTWFHSEPSALNSIPLEMFSKIPVIVSPSVSNFQKSIDRYFEKHDVLLNRYIEVSDFNLQLRLAQQSTGVCFCPQQFLRSAVELNSESDRPRVCYYPIPDMPTVNSLALVVHRNAYRSQYLKDFIHVTQEAFRAYYLNS